MQLFQTSRTYEVKKRSQAFAFSNATRTATAWQSRSGRAETAADWTRPTATKALNPDAKGQLLRLEPDGPLAYAGNRQRTITVGLCTLNQVDP
jgi:hypothetical protein